MSFFVQVWGQCVGIKTNRHGATTPFDDWAFDQAGVGRHQCGCRVSVSYTRLCVLPKLSPSGAFAVKQGFPVVVFQPFFEQNWLSALFFEVVKKHRNTLFV